MDAKGANFFFHINDQAIGQVSDAEYATGEAGFLVETLDSPRVHIHFGTTTIREVEAAPASTDVLYQDDFTDPKSGWPNNLEFGNYYIGYHEPNHYHVEVHVPHDSAVVAVPKRSFTDFTVESKVMVAPNNTAKTGDFRYGLVFRRSGNQYYAFVVSPRTGNWYVLKSSPNGLVELKKGSNDSIQGLTAEDTLRVDAKGVELLLPHQRSSHRPGRRCGLRHRRSRLLGRDPGQPARPHSLTARPRSAKSRLLLLQPVCFIRMISRISRAAGRTISSSATTTLAITSRITITWKFTCRHDRAVVAVPKRSFTDFTVASKVVVAPNNTAKTGDFRYGLVFRRSGNQYYAFVVSPRTKSWSVLKSSPSGLVELKKGSNDSIQGLTAEDTLRVDAKGSNFFFHINDQAIGQVGDADYANGEVGFLVETLDSPRAHIHYGTTTIREVEAPQLECTVITQALKMRVGPGTMYNTIATARRGARFEPLARNTERVLDIRAFEGGDATGWISSSPGLVYCNVPVADLAVRQP